MTEKFSSGNTDQSAKPADVRGKKPVVSELEVINRKFIEYDKSIQNKNNITESFFLSKGFICLYKKELKEKLSPKELDLLTDAWYNAIDIYKPIHIYKDETCAELLVSLPAINIRVPLAHELDGMAKITSPDVLNQNTSVSSFISQLSDIAVHPIDNSLNEGVADTLTSLINGAMLQKVSDDVEESVNIVKNIRLKSMESNKQNNIETKDKKTNTSNSKTSAMSDMNELDVSWE